MRGYNDLVLFRRLFRQVGSHWPYICALLLFSLLSTPIALLTPLPLKIAVDSAIGSHPVPRFVDVLLPASAVNSAPAVLVLAVGLVVFIRLLQKAQEYTTSVLRVYAGEKMVLNFRSRLFRHAQRLSLLYHDMKGTSDSAYRIQYSAASIQYIAINAIPSLATACVMLVAMIYVTFRIDWQLALVALTISPFLFLSAWAASRHLRPRWRNWNELNSSALSIAQEALAAIRVVKAFGQEERERDRFVHRSNESVRARIRLAFLQGGFTSFVGVVTAVGTAAVLFIGVRHVRSNLLTLGELLLVMSYLSQLYAPLNTLSQSGATLQASLAGAERALELLDEAPDVDERPNARALARASGAVAFRDISFAYREDHPVLHDISFEVAPGTRVGISGQTGAGKSTLMNLLVRFYDPTAGRILLDGVDLRDYKLVDLRNQFAIVLQEHSREHRLRPRGRRPGGDSRGRESRQRPRVHRRSAQRLRHQSRRARHEPLGGRAPAHLPRPRIPQRCPHPHPR
jgi:ATP-binding cassette subfamily B protein